MRSAFRLPIAVVVLHFVTSLAMSMDIVPWYTDIDAAFATAREENRPLLLHFWTTDCIPCQKLDQNVFSRKSVSETLVDFFIPVKINAQENPEFAARYHIERFPTDLILGPRDEEIHRMVTPQNAQQYVAQLSAIAFRSGIVPRNRDQQSLGNSSNDPDRFASTVSYGSEAGVDANSAAERATPAPRSNPQEVINPYAGKVRPSVGPAVGTAATTSANSDTNRQSPDSADRYDDRRFAANDRVSDPSAGLPQRRIESEDRGSSMAKANSVPTETNPKQSAMPVPSAGPNSAPGNSAIALDGYCPVTLLKRDAWQKGIARWGVIHRGRTYLFVGENEKNEFFANPDQYSPVLSGVDPVALTETGAAIEGQRAHGVLYRQQIYLFSSEENLQRFWKSPDDFAGPVLQAMKGVEPGPLRR